MVKTLNKYYNFCIIDLRMDVQFLGRLSKTKYREPVRKSIRIYKTWGLTGLVIFMDGCNAAKLWEQHKFYENIINEPHSYIFSHDIYIIRVSIYMVNFCQYLLFVSVYI